MEELANAVASEAFSHDHVPGPSRVALALAGCADLGGPILVSVALRKNDKHLAAVWNVLAPVEKQSLAILHIRRSLAGSAVRAGFGTVVEAFYPAKSTHSNRMFDVDDAGAKHGVERLLSTGIALPANDSKTSVVLGAVTLGFNNAALPHSRVNSALVHLAAELARVLPSHAAVLSRDLHDLSPALPASGKPCPTCHDNLGQNPENGNSSEPCREHPPRGDTDEGGPSGGCVALVNSSATEVNDGHGVSTSNALGMDPSQPPGSVVGMAASDDPSHDDISAAKTAARKLRFVQHPVWLTFRDRSLEQSYKQAFAEKAFKNDVYLMIVMLFYVTIIHFLPPFYLKQYSMSMATVGFYIVAFTLICCYKAKYKKNRDKVVVLWMMGIRLWALWFVKTIGTGYHKGVSEYLAFHWFFVWPIQHAMDAMGFALPIRRHLWFRVVLTIIGLLSLPYAFSSGICIYWYGHIGRETAIAMGAVNFLMAEIVPFMAVRRNEILGRATFVSQRLSAS